MMRTTGILIALGVSLAACSGSKDDGASSGGQGGGPGGTSGGATSGGSGGQGMAGSSSGGQGTSGGTSALGGAPANGGSVATSGGADTGGKSNSGGSANGGVSVGGSSSGGKNAGGSSSGGANSGGASAGGKGGGAGAQSGGASAGAGGSKAGTGGSGGATPEACAPELSRTNRTLVAKAIDELFVQKDITAADRYWADPYLQHNPIAKSGVTTFRSLMSSIVSSGSFQYERLLTLADCELAVVYGRYSQTGVIFDMFRVKNGKIMEHWDSDTNQASGATGVDPLEEQASTAANRTLFNEFASTVLVGAMPARAADFLTTGFIEHRETTTGPSAFTGYLSRENISYTKVHHVIVDGNYVFALSEGKRGSASYGFYDLFRIEAGKLAEHWDSRRSVPSSTQSGLPIF